MILFFGGIRNKTKFVSILTLSNVKHADKVLESVSRQARLQRVLRQRLRNPWSQLKSQIVVFNKVEF